MFASSLTTTEPAAPLTYDPQAIDWPRFDAALHRWESDGVLREQLAELLRAAADENPEPDADA